MSDFKEIDIHQVHKLLKKDHVNIIDIRDPQSFSEGHLEHARNLDGHTVAEFLAAADKMKPVLCYCYHGFNSQQAAMYFVENGFQDVYSMKGGFEAWRPLYPFVQERP